MSDHMPENNEQLFRRLVASSIVGGVRYDSSCHRLSATSVNSVSPGEMERLLSVARAYGIESFRAQNLISEVCSSLPGSCAERSATPVYGVNIGSENPGTMIYMEVADAAGASSAASTDTMRLMVMSPERLLVLDSTERGLLPCDILFPASANIQTGAPISVEVAGIDGRHYVSAPVRAIRRYRESLLHQAVDARAEVCVPLAHGTEDSTVDLRTPPMLLLMRDYIDSPDRLRLTVGAGVATDSEGNNYVQLTTDQEWKKTQI